MTKDLKSFLRKHKKSLKLSEIEKMAKLPLGTLSLILNDNPHRHLSDDQERRVMTVLDKLGTEIKEYVK